MQVRGTFVRCPAYRATLLYTYVVTHEVMRDEHEFLL
jgi:hypothetical protein